MRKVARVFCLVLLLAGSFAGQADAWKQYKNAEGNFRVLFPGEPQDSVNKNDANMQSHTLMAVEKPVFYTVVYTNMTNEQTVDDANFQVFKNAVFKELPKCQVGAERAASPSVDGFIGRGYRLSCAMPNAQIALTGNLYWGKHHAYALMAMFPDDVSEPATVKTFVESFSVIDPAK